MADPDEELQFDEAEPTPIVTRMAQQTDAGAGWINLLPEIDDDVEVPTSRSLFSFFSARGPSIPLATWAAGAPGKRGPGRASIGIQHAAGPKALARLAGVGLVRPAGWVKVQDHPRRGVVITVPAGADNEDVLHWLLSATHALSTVPLTGGWLARVYTGGRS